MSSASTHFPPSNVGSRVFENSHGSLHSPPSALGLYSLDKCVNCGYRYVYEKPKNDLNGDATLAWKRLSAVVTDHYSLCPRKFANIHLPTSALRETLNESDTKKCSKGEKSRATSAPYVTSFRQPPTRPIYHPESSRHHPYRRDNTRSALPESSRPHERQIVPELVELSRRTAEPTPVGTIKSTPHYSNRSSGTYDPSAFLPSMSPTPRRPLTRRPSYGTPPTPRLSMSDPIPPAATPPAVSPALIPPIWNRKRKRTESQEDVAEDRHLIPQDEVEEHKQRQTDYPSRQPFLGTHSEQDVSKESLRDQDDERPDKRLKKNVMDPDLRREELEADPILVIVSPKDVYCGICKRWIKLDARNDYYPGLWRKHRRTMHEVVSESQWRCIRSERERKGEILEERDRQRLTERETTERQFKVSTKYNKEGGTSRTRRPGLPQGQEQPSTTRTSPSSSRIARSYSRGSTS